MRNGGFLYGNHSLCEYLCPQGAHLLPGRAGPDVKLCKLNRGAELASNSSPYIHAHPVQPAPSPQKSMLSVFQAPNAIVILLREQLYFLL